MQPQLLLQGWHRRECQAEETAGSETAGGILDLRCISRRDFAWEQQGALEHLWRSPGREAFQLSCCRHGQQRYLGLKVLHPEGSDSCGLCWDAAEIGIGACSGQGRPHCLNKDAKQLPKEGPECKLLAVKCEN